MKNKICNCCKIEKDINEYYNNKKFIDNKSPTCKKCVKEKALKYYYDNKEDIKEKLRLKGESEEFKKYQKDYLEKNRKEINQVKRYYKIKNRDKILQERKLYYNRRKNDPIFILIRRLRNGIYRSLRSNKTKSSLHILGCTPEEFKIHIENQFTEGMSWDKLSEIHIDHIIPISSAQTIEEVYKLNHHTNLQPLWAEDNLKKGSKII
jgi:hypothetical protein